MKLLSFVLLDTVWYIVNLHCLVRFVADHDALQDWSVSEPAEFWNLLWDFCGVVGDKGDRWLIDGDKMPPILDSGRVGFERPRGVPCFASIRVLQALAVSTIRLTQPRVE